MQNFDLIFLGVCIKEKLLFNFLSVELPGENKLCMLIDFRRNIFEEAPKEVL